LHDERASAAVRVAGALALLFWFSSLPRRHCTSFPFLYDQENSKAVGAARRHHTSSTRKASRTFGPLPAAIRRASMAPSQKFRAQLARAKKKGNTLAQAFVHSCLYSFGKEGVTRDLTLAFKFGRMAAEGGDTECQYNLGALYDTGQGVERDDRKATAWFPRAAKEGGDSEAHSVPDRATLQERCWVRRTEGSRQVVPSGRSARPRRC
jgi:TPR repeat protein